MPTVSVPLCTGVDPYTDKAIKQEQDELNVISPFGSKYEVFPQLQVGPGWWQRIGRTVRLKQCFYTLQMYKDGGIYNTKDVRLIFARLKHEATAMTGSCVPVLYNFPSLLVDGAANNGLGVCFSEDYEVLHDRLVSVNLQGSYDGTPTRSHWVTNGSFDIDQTAMYSPNGAFLGGQIVCYFTTVGICPVPEETDVFYQVTVNVTFVDE